MKVGDLVRQIRGQSRVIGVVVVPPEVHVVGKIPVAHRAGILWPNGNGGVYYHSTVWLEVVCEDR